jgi:hypothetical protein
LLNNGETRECGKETLGQVSDSGDMSALLTEQKHYKLQGRDFLLSMFVMNISECIVSKFFPVW